MIPIGIALGLTVYAVVVFMRCFFRVEEGHRALLTSFGAIITDDKERPRSYGPGLHRKAPWHSVHGVSVMEQNGTRQDPTAMTVLAAEREGQGTGDIRASLSEASRHRGGGRTRRPDARP